MGRPPLGLPPVFSGAGRAHSPAGRCIAATASGSLHSPARPVAALMSIGERSPNLRWSMAHENAPRGHQRERRGCSWKGFAFCLRAAEGSGVSASQSKKRKTSMTARGMLPRTWLGWHFVRSLVVTGGQRGSLQAGNLDFPLDKGGKGGYVPYPTDLPRKNRLILPDGLPVEQRKPTPALPCQGGSSKTGQRDVNVTPGIR